MKKTLILYLYREDKQTKLNLDFFLKNAIIQSNLYTYLFIINDHICSLDIPTSDNILVLKKENSYDLSSYKEALEFTGKNFDYFVFLNSSCVGPFLPVYESTPWPELFTSQLNNTVKLIGPIAEIPKDNFGSKSIEEHKFVKKEEAGVPFIHTYMFAVDIEGLLILEKYNAFNEEKITRFELVHIYERLITSSLLNEGFKVKCLLYKFKNVDLSDKRNWNFKLWSKNRITDPEIPSNYNGIDVHPFELIFFKNIRNRHSYRPFLYSGLSRYMTKVTKLYLSWA